MSLAPTLERLHPNPRPKWWQAFQQIHQQLANVVNKNIEFGNPTSGPANIKGQWGSVAGSTTIVTPAANTDFIVTHNLGQPAVGVDIKSKNATVDVYTSPTVNASPNTQIILRATNASVTITLFIH
jgi:hypothetical protein